MGSALSQAILGLGARWVAPQDVRAEAWALGSRHQGQVTEGARRELCAPNITARRTMLLKAVIRAERSPQRAPGRRVS